MNCFKYFIFFYIIRLNGLYRFFLIVKGRTVIAYIHFILTFADSCLFDNHTTLTYFYILCKNKTSTLCHKNQITPKLRVSLTNYEMNNKCYRITESFQLPWLHRALNLLMRHNAMIHFINNCNAISSTKRYKYVQYLKHIFQRDKRNIFNNCF